MLMKMSVFLLFLSFQAFAITEKIIFVGQPEVIQAQTLVTCASNGPTGNLCEDSTDGFRAVMENCMKVWNGGACAEKYWPSFKKSIPQCTYSAVKLCLSVCEKGYNVGVCRDICQ